MADSSDDTNIVRLFISRIYWKTIALGHIKIILLTALYGYKQRVLFKGKR
jgi:hypothetical protein